MSSGYALHPAAFGDLNDIRDYIAQEDPDAADRVILEILTPFAALCLFLIRGIDARTSVRGLCGSLLYVNTYCLRTGGKALVGCRGDARTPEPARYGRDPE